MSVEESAVLVALQNTRAPLLQEGFSLLLNEGCGQFARIAGGLEQSLFIGTGHIGESGSHLFLDYMIDVPEVRRLIESVQVPGQMKGAYLPVPGLTRSSKVIKNLQLTTSLQADEISEMILDAYRSEGRQWFEGYPDVASLERELNSDPQTSRFHDTLSHLSKPVLGVGLARLCSNPNYKNLRKAYVELVMMHSQEWADWYYRFLHVVETQLEGPDLSSDEFALFGGRL